MGLTMEVWGNGGLWEYLGGLMWLLAKVFVLIEVSQTNEGEACMRCGEVDL